MTEGHWIGAAIGLAAASYLGWKALKCMHQARQLLRWRRPSVKGLDDQLAALRGEVKVRQPVNGGTAGDCLWKRDVAQVLVGTRTQSWKAVSDISAMAEFSIVIDGREFAIKDPPTRVYGAHFKRTSGGDKLYMKYWLPIVGHLTVLGRVHQKHSSSEIVQDPKVGLIFSIHPAERTAFRELVKGGLLLGLAASVLAAIYFFLTSPR